MDPILRVEELKKNYGSLEAVKGISFEVKPGEIFALIGPNGAGKTTTLRIIATILQPTSGSVQIDNINVLEEPAVAREIISYLPEEAGAYKNMTGEDYLRFIARLFFNSQEKQEACVEQAKAIIKLGERIKDKAGSYSKGMLRKLLLGKTLMTQPKLAILDEPTSGLDVMNALETRNIIKNYVQTGMSVLLSSHNMLEIEYLSDRVAIIEKGVIHEAGTPEELKNKYSASNLEEVFVGVVR